MIGPGCKWYDLSVQGALLKEILREFLHLRRLVPSVGRCDVLQPEFPIDPITLRTMSGE